jgi:putative DNA primase/helicase
MFRFQNRSKTPELAKTIIATELSGVLNYLVEGVESLVKNGKFDIPEAVRVAVEEFRQEADNVLAFLNDNRLCPDAEKYITLRELYDAYKKQCTRDSTKAVEKAAFSRRLRNLA